MLGINELKAKRAPHVDLGHVLMHVAGIHVKESKRCAGQKEKKEKANTPPQACGRLFRLAAINSPADWRPHLRRLEIELLKAAPLAIRKRQIWSKTCSLVNQASSKCMHLATFSLADLG